MITRELKDSATDCTRVPAAQCRTAGWEVLKRVRGQSVRAWHPSNLSRSHGKWDDVYLKHLLNFEATWAELASSCSHTRMTVHPIFRNSLFTNLSLFLFAWSFFFQNDRLFLGMLECFGHPCQKQPSTNKAILCFRNTKSGLPNWQFGCILIKPHKDHSLSLPKEKHETRILFGHNCEFSQKLKRWDSWQTCNKQRFCLGRNSARRVARRNPYFKEGCATT